MGAMDLSITPVTVHPEFEEHFSLVDNVVLYFMDYVLRVGSKLKTKRKVLIVTEASVFLCQPNGGINRYIRLKDVERIVYGGRKAHVALCLRTEGRDRQPSFDLCFRTGNMDFLMQVLLELIQKRWLKHVAVRRIPDTEDFPSEELNLAAPPGWHIVVDDDVLECVQVLDEPDPFSTAQQQHHQQRTSLPHHTQPHHAALRSPTAGPSASPSPSPAPQQPPQADPASAATLCLILKKLESVESEIAGIKSGAAASAASAAAAAAAGGTTRRPSRRAQSAAKYRGASEDDDSDEDDETDAETERSGLRSPSPRNGGGGGAGEGGVATDAAARELSLRSYEEVRAIRHELAQSGYIRPSQAFGDSYYCPPAGATAGSPLPATGNGNQIHALSPPSALPQQPQQQGFSPPSPPPPLPPPHAFDPQQQQQQQLPEQQLVFCWHCHRDLSDSPTVPRCSGCRSAVYCGRQCQTVHWARHKLECKMSNALGPAGAAGPSPEDAYVGGISYSPTTANPRGNLAAVSAQQPQIYVVHTDPAAAGAYAASPGGGGGGVPSRPKKKKKKAKNSLPPPPPLAGAVGASPAAPQRPLPPPAAAVAALPAAATPAAPAASAFMAAEGVPHMSPDAQRDRVYDARATLPETSLRPPPPPAPVQALPSGNTPGDYDALFTSYKQYYTDVLLGEDPQPPASLYS